VRRARARGGGAGGAAGERSGADGRVGRGGGGGERAGAGGDGDRVGGGAEDGGGAREEGARRADGGGGGGSQGGWGADVFVATGAGEGEVEHVKLHGSGRRVADRTRSIRARAMLRCDAALDTARAASSVRPRL